MSSSVAIFLPSNEYIVLTAPGTLTLSSKRRVKSSVKLSNDLNMENLKKIKKKNYKKKYTDNKPISLN